MFRVVTQLQPGKNSYYTTNNKAKICALITPVNINIEQEKTNKASIIKSAIRSNKTSYGQLIAHEFGSVGAVILHAKVANDQ